MNKVHGKIQTKTREMLGEHRKFKENVRKIKEKHENQQGGKI